MTDKTDKKEVESTEEVAKVIVHSCDQGHYGGMMCGKCGTSLSNYGNNALPDHCPNCGVKLGEHTYETYNSGGSDF